MACMEHDCSCGFFTANNRPSMTCPNCGEKCFSTFDEVSESPDYSDYSYRNTHEEELDYE